MALCPVDFYELLIAKGPCKWGSVDWSPLHRVIWNKGARGTRGRRVMKQHKAPLCLNLEASQQHVVVKWVRERESWGKMKTLVTTMTSLTPGVAALNAARLRKPQGSNQTHCSQYTYCGLQRSDKSSLQPTDSVVIQIVEPICVHSSSWLCLKATESCSEAEQLATRTLRHCSLSRSIQLLLRLVICTPSSVSAPSAGEH